MTTSFDVHIWALEVRRTKVTGYRVRWRVTENKFGETFATRQLADAYRATLLTAAKRGEPFGTDTGLPESMTRKLTDITFYAHAAEFAAAMWPAVSAKSRIGMIETLSRTVPVVVLNLAGRPEDGLLRAALRKDLNQGPHDFLADRLLLSGDALDGEKAQEALDGGFGIDAGMVKSSCPAFTGEPSL